eukprot:11160882-Lingulodinium_polyedra.AAC.1
MGTFRVINGKTYRDKSNPQVAGGRALEDAQHYVETAPADGLAQYFDPRADVPLRLNAGLRADLSQL